jgi:hypothetical protein
MAEVYHWRSLNTMQAPRRYQQVSAQEVSAVADSRWRCTDCGILEFDDLEFDDQYADFARPKIFNSVRRKRRHPLCAGNGRRFSRLAAIEQNIATSIPPNEVTPALHIRETTPTVGMQGDYIACRDRGMKNTHAVIFEQECVMLRRCHQRIE